VALVVGPPWVLWQGFFAVASGGLICDPVQKVGVGDVFSYSNYAQDYAPGQPLTMTLNAHPGSSEGAKVLLWLFGMSIWRGLVALTRDWVRSTEGREEQTRTIL
jgi:hypothetical protein